MRLLICGLLMSGLVGCGPTIVLQPASATLPAGIDFSGDWTIAPNSAESIDTVREAGFRAAGGNQSLVPGRRSKSSEEPGALAHVFLEIGRDLRISQTPHGLFISFDRSVVEEYRFGEQRVISVGPVEAQRVSGWRGTTYLIETLTEDSARLTETWRLANGELLRSIRIVRRNDELLAVEQRFRRST